MTGFVSCSGSFDPNEHMELTNQLPWLRKGERCLVPTEVSLHVGLSGQGHHSPLLAPHLGHRPVP